MSKRCLSASTFGRPEQASQTRDDNARVDRDPKLPLFDDADETVRAIHQGNVDAIVVMRSLEGPQVILLQGAEEPYRVLVERMSDGALTAGPDGIILYVNDRLCELTGYSVLESCRPRPRFTVRGRAAEACSRGDGGGEPVAQRR